VVAINDFNIMIQLNISSGNNTCALLLRQELLSLSRPCNLTAAFKVEQEVAHEKRTKTPTTFLSR
jgi:hypothetical protein